MGAARSPLVPFAFIGLAACWLGMRVGFVGGPRHTPLRLRGEGIVARVSASYLERQGPKDSDVPFAGTAATGPETAVEFKKRPFGIARYAPGRDGTGAVVMEVTPKSRYPGDPQGQAFVAGVQPSWVVKAVNGMDVTGVKFEDIMELLDDEVLDPVAALSLNLKESGTPTDFSDKSRTADTSYGAVGESTFKFGQGNKAELPITVQYVEQR
uniref:PDZ domain-containing protein n=1 Tax=Zooxanthella nutricula TaxID=1333877 RepID=A0A7S2JJV3_9DINO